MVTLKEWMGKVEVREIIIRSILENAAWSIRVQKKACKQSGNAFKVRIWE